MGRDKSLNRVATNDLYTFDVTYYQFDGSLQAGPSPGLSLSVKVLIADRSFREFP